MEVEKKISDYYCEICKDLWLEPVTLPCNHTMCKECYFQNEAANPLQCPFCKKSVRSWTRRAKKEKSYVNVALWTETRRLFPVEVTKRLEGESVDIPDAELDFSYVQSRRHYDQGELRREYEKEKERRETELEQRRQEEEAESSSLLRTLMVEEEEARKAEEERRRQEEEDAKLAAKLASQASPPKLPPRKVTRAKGKAPAVPKDQPTLNRTVVVTPKRKETRRALSSLTSLSSPSSSSPSASQRSLQNALDIVHQRIRSPSPESPEFDLSTPRIRRRPAAIRERCDVFGSSDEDDLEVDVRATTVSPDVEKPPTVNPIRPGEDSSPWISNDVAFDSTSQGDDNVDNDTASKKSRKETKSRISKKLKSKGTSRPSTSKPDAVDCEPSDDTGHDISVHKSVTTNDEAKTEAIVNSEKTDDVDDKKDGKTLKEIENIPSTSRNKRNASLKRSLDPEGATETDPGPTISVWKPVDTDSSDFEDYVPVFKKGPDDSMSPSYDSRFAQRLMAEDLERARAQEEEDQKLARKLQRQFQDEMKREMTKRPEGYGTRSRSPASKLKRAKGSPSSSKARSKSLATDDDDADFDPCTHGAAGGAAHCSFCLLTSPRPAGRERGGPSGKELKRKTSTRVDAVSTKRRKTTL